MYTFLILINDQIEHQKELQIFIFIFLDKLWKFYWNKTTHVNTGGELREQHNQFLRTSEKSLSELCVICWL